MRVGCLSKLALALHLDPSQCLVMENFCLLPDGARFMVDMGHSGLGWIQPAEGLLSGHYFSILGWGLGVPPNMAETGSFRSE